MRLKLLATILALLPAPAFADVTARYSAGKEVVTVEADDGGNSRIGIDGKFSIIRRDGTDYVVLIPPGGETKVAELSEVVLIMSGVFSREDAKGAESLKVEKFLLIDKGEVTVGKRKGTLWAFGPEKEHDGRVGKLLDIVMSADPDLAPIAAIFRRTIEMLLPVIGATISESSGFMPKARDLVSKGTPLRIDKLALQSVDTAEIDAKRFKLPAPVTGALELLSAMESGGGAALEIKPLP